MRKKILFLTILSLFPISNTYASDVFNPDDFWIEKYNYSKINLIRIKKKISSENEEISAGRVPAATHDRLNFLHHRSNFYVTVCYLLNEEINYLFGNMQFCPILNESIKLNVQGLIADLIDENKKGLKEIASFQNEIKDLL